MLEFKQLLKELRDDVVSTDPIYPINARALHCLAEEIERLSKEVERLKRGPVSEDGEKLYQEIKEQMRSKGYRVP